MTIYPVDQSQRIAAKAVGTAYLLTDATAIFAQFYVRGNLIIHSNAAKTVDNIAASEQLFRLGIACDLFTFAGVILLTVGCYVILRPVDRGLAMLGAFWRLTENAVLVVATFPSFAVLELLSRAHYFQTFEPDRLQALAMLSIDVHDDGYQVGLIFAGLGTAVFSYLFFKSHYIPRVLAGWGVFGSLLTAASTFAFVVFPKLSDVLEPWCYVPLLIFELGTALWLLIKGLRTLGATQADKF